MKKEQPTTSPQPPKSAPQQSFSVPIDYQAVIRQLTAQLADLAAQNAILQSGLQGMRQLLEEAQGEKGKGEDATD